MPVAEMLQLLFGLTIPLLLTIHIVGTRLTHEFFGVDDSYTLMVLTLWHAAPMDGLKQAILIVIAWTHGCIGCHYWLRLKKWYPRIAPYLLTLALLIPVCGLLGFVGAGREVSNLIARQPEWLERFLVAAKVPPRSQRAVLYQIYDGVLITFGAAIVLALIARGRAQLDRAAQPHPHYVSQWPGGAGAAQFLRPRSEPSSGDSPCFGLRRPRALLNLPSAGHSWRSEFAGAGCRRVESLAARRRRARC